MTSVPEELLRSYSLPEPVETYSWGRSREAFFKVGGLTCQSLRNQLLIAEKELQLKGEEKRKLEGIRDELEINIDELTANLFENANKMVVDANVKRMEAEKELETAQKKITQLQADINAMKTLFASKSAANGMTTPNDVYAAHQPSPPQPLQTPVVKKKFSLSKNSFRRRSQPKSSVDLSPADSEKALVTAAKVSTGRSDTGAPGDTCPPPLEDTEGLEEFISWKKSPELSEESPFIRRLVAEDVKPCFNFNNKELSGRLVDDVVKNMLSVEPLTSQHRMHCELTNREVICSHQIRLTANQHPLSISQETREMIVTVCELFSYLGHIKHQLFKKQNDRELFERIRLLRKNMVLQRLGFPVT